MHDYHTKKISLPSGQSIEIIYLIDPDEQGTRDASAAGAGAAETVLPLHRCPECGSDLVYPMAWQETADGQWQVDRRCPNCEWLDAGKYGHDEIEPFDDAVELGTEVLLTELRTWAYANMSDDVERLIAALEQDLIARTG